MKLLSHGKCHWIKLNNSWVTHQLNNIWFEVDQLLFNNSNYGDKPAW